MTAAPVLPGGTTGAALPPHVRTAFGVQDAEPRPVVWAGRRAWHCGDVLVRPVPDNAVAAWSATRDIIDSLLDVQQKKMAVLYQPLMAEMDSAAGSARAISDSTQAAMREVLTEDQRVKLDQLREEARKQAAERRARRTDWWRKVQ